MIKGHRYGGCKGSPDVSSLVPDASGTFGGISPSVLSRWKTVTGRNIRQRITELQHIAPDNVYPRTSHVCPDVPSSPWFITRQCNPLHASLELDSMM